MKLSGLYAITDNHLLGQGRLLPYVTAALEGGARLLQYRDKLNSASERLREAEALADLCQRYGAALIINDDAELAARLGVGVHLGQDDGSLAAARALLPQGAVIGSSCHASLELAATAQREGASYVAFGRFFNSKTKPGTPTATLELLQQARQQVSLPIVAIGGITLEQAPSLVEHGASMLAVINALFGADTPQEVEQRARAFSRLFG